MFVWAVGGVGGTLSHPRVAVASLVLVRFICVCARKPVVAQKGYQQDE